MEASKNVVFIGCLGAFPRTFRSFGQAVTLVSVLAYIEIVATLPIFGKIFFGQVKVTERTTKDCV
jgi:hypothetical protein